MLDAKGLEAAIDAAVKDAPDGGIELDIGAAITAYLQEVGPEPVADHDSAALIAARQIMTITRQGKYDDQLKAQIQCIVLEAIRSALVATPPAEPVVETDWINYRPLAEGEIIQDGDECLTDSHLGWQPAANTVGSAAPDPSYTAHRMYRRPLATKPAVKDDETVVEALPLREIRRRVRNIWGAISSNQVIDKDVEGQSKRLLADIDAALAAKDGRS